MSLSELLYLLCLVVFPIDNVVFLLLEYTMEECCDVRCETDFFYT